MQKNIYILPLLIALTALTGCKDYEEERRLFDPVDAELAFSVSSSPKIETRMAQSVVEGKDSDGKFRGLKMLRAFPFGIASNATKVKETDMPKTFETNGFTEEYTGKTSTDNLANGAAFYYVENCTFLPGVNAFLAYAAANSATGNLPAYSSNSTIEDKFCNGSLKANIPLRGYPDQISFEPDKIKEENNIPDDGAAIAAYLTGIANATGWSTATESYLRAYYLNFIGQGNDGSVGLVASSSKNVEKFVGELRTQISALSFPAGSAEANIRSAILAAIGQSYPSAYPASIGLPAGAAAVRWNKEQSRFEVQYQPTTEASINAFNRFAYPAELYFHANSRILTSSIDNRKSYYDSSQKWSDVLAAYTSGTVVSSSTTSVAIVDPLQYGVARLELMLNSVSTPLKDADNNTITVGDTNFPLTGIVVGSQRPVDFAFVPKAEDDGTYSDLNVRFVYDPHAVAEDNSNICLYTSASSPNASKAATTMLLQTPDDEEVTLILEFENNSGRKFRGKDGVVYPDTKFYLIGTIDPSDGVGTDTNTLGRVFTQDYTTKVMVTVSSLAKAYNVMPDILTGRLEIGVLLHTDWIAPTPSDVTLN